MILGLNHKTAPIEIREKVSFSTSGISDGLSLLQKCHFVRESLILSTCNRVELYAVVEDKLEGLKSLKEFLYQYHELKDSLEPYLYFYENELALRHTFRVASSLDSMVVGENQIFSQVKQAYMRAQEAGSMSRVLTSVFQEALRVAKMVRTQTGISKGAVSIGSAAVELAKEILKDLKDKKILIIGAGKVGELTVKNLAERGVNLILVANRTFENAVKLAQIFQGKAIKFAQLNEALKEVDIVISSTNSPHYILRKKDILSVISERGHKPLFLIDLSVPRNIERAVSEIKDTHLYNIDDLQKISQLNLKERLKETYKAEKMVKEESDKVYAAITDARFKSPANSPASFLFPLSIICGKIGIGSHCA